MTQIIRLAEAVTITPRTDIEVVRLVEAVKSHGPQIIRTVGELEALDPDTYLIDRSNYGLTKSDWVSYYESFDQPIFPLAVIATGEQVREAQQALKEQEQ